MQILPGDWQLALHKVVLVVLLSLPLTPPTFSVFLCRGQRLTLGIIPLVPCYFEAGSLTSLEVLQVSWLAVSPKDAPAFSSLELLFQVCATTPGLLFFLNMVSRDELISSGYKADTLPN